MGHVKHVALTLVCCIVIVSTRTMQSNYTRVKLVCGNQPNPEERYSWERPYFVNYHTIDAKDRSDLSVGVLKPEDYAEYSARIPKMDSRIIKKRHNAENSDIQSDQPFESSIQSHYSRSKMYHELEHEVPPPLPEIEEEKTITIVKNIEVPYPVEKTIRYPVVKNIPYPVQIPVPEPYPVEKSIPYPVKVMVKIPQRFPLPIPIYKEVPYAVQIPIERRVPYRVYIPKPYPVERKIHYEVKVPVPEPFPIERNIPIPIKIPIAIPQPIPVEKPVHYPVEVKVDRPVPVPVPKPYPVQVIKHVPYPVIKPRPVPVEVKVDKPVPYPVVKHVPYPVEVPVPQPVPVEKEVPYPVIKHVPKPVEVPIDRPLPVHVEKYVPVSDEKDLSYYASDYKYQEEIAQGDESKDIVQRKDDQNHQIEDDIKVKRVGEKTIPIKFTDDKNKTKPPEKPKNVSYFDKSMVKSRGSARYGQRHASVSTKEKSSERLSEYKFNEKDVAKDSKITDIATDEKETKKEDKTSAHQSKENNEVKGENEDKENKNSRHRRKTGIKRLVRIRVNKNPSRTTEKSDISVISGDKDDMKTAIEAIEANNDRKNEEKEKKIDKFRRNYRKRNYRRESKGNGGKEKENKEKEKKTEK